MLLFKKIFIFFCRFYLVRKETASVEIVQWYKSTWRNWIWGRDQRICVDFWKSNRLGIANWVNWDFWNRWKPTKNRHSNRHAITTRSKFTLTISYIPLYFHFWYFEIFDRRTLIWRVLYYGVKRRNIWQLVQGMDGSRSLNLFIRTQTNSFFPKFNLKDLVLGERPANRQFKMPFRLLDRMFCKNRQRQRFVGKFHFGMVNNFLRLLLF